MPEQTKQVKVILMRTKESQKISTQRRKDAKTQRRKGREGREGREDTQSHKI